MIIVDKTIFKNDLKTYVDAAINYNDTVFVTSNKGNVVLMNEDDYSNMKSLTNKSETARIIEGEKEDTNNMSTYNPSEAW